MFVCPLQLLYPFTLSLSLAAFSQEGRGLCVWLAHLIQSKEMQCHNPWIRTLWEKSSIRFRKISCSPFTQVSDFFSSEKKGKSVMGETFWTKKGTD